MHIRSYYIIFSLFQLANFFDQTLMAQSDRKSASAFFYNQTPPHLYDMILSRPTDHAITISLFCDSSITGYIQYGEGLNTMKHRSSEIQFDKGIAVPIILSGLRSNTRYYYQFIYQKAANAPVERSAVFYFQTQRPMGEPFVFTIQADSHLDENTSTEMYARTLQNIAADSSDFLIDLGDTWMTDKYSPAFKESFKQYVAQRYYFGIPGSTTPLFLSLGNHDGEYEWRKNDRSGESMLSWASSTRKQFYFNPEPNGFYKGCAGLDQNYYAWEWGNALFIVLDPFRYSVSSRDPWNRTLGKVQYEWLKETLAASKKKLKFIFIHNLVGGIDNKGLGRGGAEASIFYEWGGRNIDSTNGFAAHRPDWIKPIHDLLVEYHVNAVFHGHDHLFVQQDRDQIVYQALSQPGAMRYGNINSATDYGYRSGVIMNAPGYLRVTVDKDTAKIEFVQTSITSRYKNGSVLNTYTITTK